MKTASALFGIVSTVCMLLFVASGIPESVAEEKLAAANQERIGVYDSRAVAVAYAGSKPQKEKMEKLVAQRKEAQEAGNAAEVARIEGLGKEWQLTLKKQGFGTAPVDDLLELIAADLPGIQKTAGVSKLISKWDEAALARYPKADRVDVTMPLVEAFHPGEKQKKYAVEIQTKKPEVVKE